MLVCPLFPSPVPERHDLRTPDAVRIEGLRHKLRHNFSRCAAPIASGKPRVGGLIQRGEIGLTPSHRKSREFGGASRDRTDDLIVANDALSQLSYSPVRRGFTFFDFTSRRSISPIQVIL